MNSPELPPAACPMQAGGQVSSGVIIISQSVGFNPITMGLKSQFIFEFVIPTMNRGAINSYIPGVSVGDGKV